MSLTSNNATDSNDQNLVVIKGGTDNTSIGNVGDSLKVTGSFASDSVNLDAFGRLRVSNPDSVFHSTFAIDKQPLLFSELTASGGTVTQDTNKKAIILSCTTTTNSSAKFQSRRYITYHPGKSQLIYLSGNLKSAATNVTKTIGQYDDNNGLFFQLAGNTLSVVVRSKVSGSVVDTTINQSSWNIDKLDGTGASGLTLDLSKQQIFIINYQWLGSGRVIFGFDINGIFYKCHQVLNANNLTTLYSQTGTLPIRCSILNASATASTMEFTCVSVQSEGAYLPEGILRTMNNGSTSISFAGAGSRKPLISIRKQSTYIDKMIDVVDLSVFTNSSDDFLVEIVVNGTLTSPSWGAVTGIAEKDVTASAISNGTIIYSFYVAGSANGTSVFFSDIFQQAENLLIGSDLSLVSDIISVVGTNLTTTANISTVINYKEYY